MFYAKTPPWCLRKKPSLSVNCYFFLPTAAEICGGILFSHSFCSDLPTTQCQTPHGKNYTDAWKETQKSRKNVEVDSVHRSSHDGSSKLLKESTTHICPENNSHTSRGLLTCCWTLLTSFTATGGCGGAGDAYRLPGFWAPSGLPTDAPKILSWTSLTSILRGGLLKTEIHLPPRPPLHAILAIFQLFSK